MIRVTTLEEKLGWNGSAVSVHQGAIINGCLITFRCGHTHTSKLDAQLCANREARTRGLPVTLPESEDAHEGSAMPD